MACVYEEEIYGREGKVESCGCGECPYKNIEDCKEAGDGENDLCQIG